MMASDHVAFAWATQPNWRDQVQHRLVAEFVDRATTAEIDAEINRAHAEIDAVPAAAVPELVERLVRVRLAHRC